MALFNGQDADLPLLTQIMQINCDLPGEIEEFIHRRVKILSQSGRGRPFWCDRDDFTKDEENALIQKELECLEDFGAVCKLTQQILHRFVFEQRYHKDNLDELYFWLDKYPLTQTLEMVPAKVGLSRLWNQQGWIEADSICWQMYPHFHRTSIENLLAEICNHFRFACRGLSTCEECNNIYERRRTDHKYCSDRCSSRVRQRRWQHEKRSIITGKDVHAALESFITD
jgi:hypothetical protein